MTYIYYFNLYYWKDDLITSSLYLIIKYDLIIRINLHDNQCNVRVQLHLQVRHEYNRHIHFAQRM